MTDQPAADGSRSPLEPVRIDMSDLTLEQRGAVLDHLRSTQRYHELDGDLVVVQARHEAEVRQLIASAAPWSPVDQLPVVTAAAVRRRRQAMRSIAAEPDLAARWARFAGWLIDLLLGVVVWLIVRTVVEDDQVGPLIAYVGYSAVTIIAVATRGWSPGKWVVRTRVVGPGGTPPGWTRAVVRFAVPFVPTAAGDLAGQVSPTVGVSIAELGTIAVYAGILVRRDRRGVHDLVAGTRVVRVDALRRSAAVP